MSVTELMEEEGEEEESQQQQNINSSHKEQAVAEIVTEQAQQEEYTWPVIKFEIPPYRTYHFSQQFRNASNPNNFLKGVKWSPDGSCFITNSEDNILREFTMPEHGSDDHVSACSVNAGEDSFMANLVVDEGESVYDFCWYPYMTASDPITCVFATTSRDHPIHLWDATSGQAMYKPKVGVFPAKDVFQDNIEPGHSRHTRMRQLRCTYRAYDNMDEITAAFSVAFNPSGTKMFAGYNKSLRVFDIHRPGRDFKQYSTLQGNKEGQSGIISAIGFSPHSGMLATGSYNQTTAIYREDNMELLYILHGQEGGVTHVQFSKDGNYLYTGGRKDPYILCWDIRNTVETVYKLYRSTESTNQRVLFDIEPSGKHLATGGQDGLVHFYDLQTGQWVSSFQAALDTINGFSFHPFLPMAATTSGQRRFGIPDENSDEFSVSGDENCASVWSFTYDLTMEDSSGNSFNSGISNSVSLAEP